MSEQSPAPFLLIERDGPADSGELLTSGDAGDQPSDLRVTATFMPKPWRAPEILTWLEEAAGLKEPPEG